MTDVDTAAIRIEKCGAPYCGPCHHHLPAVLDALDDVRRERDQWRGYQDVAQEIERANELSCRVAVMQPVVDAATYLVDLWRRTAPGGLLSQGELARQVDTYREGLPQGRQS